MRVRALKDCYINDVFRKKGAVFTIKDKQFHKTVFEKLDNTPYEPPAPPPGEDDDEDPPVSGGGSAKNKPGKKDKGKGKDKSKDDDAGDGKPTGDKDVI